MLAGQLDQGQEMVLLHPTWSLLVPGQHEKTVVIVLSGDKNMSS